MACSFSGAGQQQQQHRPMDVPNPTQNTTEPERTRLILKDGTYQLVLSYTVVGNVVHYRSAEREGQEEDIPLALVDLPATEQWKKDHEPGAREAQESQPPVLSPELAKEEAARAALTPEIAPNLHLPEEDSVLALDTYRDTPELVPMPQSSSDLNKETAHAVQKGVINPASAPHRITDIPRERADVQLHVPDPVFYVRVNGGNPDDAVYTGGGTFTVDTHGASGRATPSGGDPNNSYVIERVDVRQDARIVDSLRIALLGTGRTQRDIVETRAEILPGGHWMKLTPLQPLDFGEYALIEVLGPNAVNLDVWDFGVHSDAPENIEAIHPEAKRAPTLEPRRP
ncbi:MAG TPA: hypothetical protein VFA99_14070 [Acidobacteriaceae bacterium]|nr:hypothetical protein [Acidobacteriaceae bacterium]